ncbi:MAG: type II toxin-antitoxin system VapC family toxin [Gemmataceae bacterium]
MNVLLDTNILVRSFVPSDRDRPCLVPQHVYEFWVVSTRPAANNGRGLSAAEAAAEVAFLESNLTLLPDPATLYAEWKRLVTTHGVVGKPAHDARLVAAMLAQGVTHLLTFNGAHFTRFPGVVVDPRTLATPPVGDPTPPKAP